MAVAFWTETHLLSNGGFFFFFLGGMFGAIGSSLTTLMIIVLWANCFLYVFVVVQGLLE
jgi:hypothetical protein